MLLNIFVHFVFRNLWWIESSNEQHLFEIEIFCNIINVFTVTFDASWLNKTIHFFYLRHLNGRKYVFNFDKLSKSVY